MKQTFWLFQILAITLSFSLVISFLAVEPAYSRGGGGGGCFSRGTLILTPEGSKTIEQLHSGDRVINYNFSTHHQDLGTIRKIEIINSPDYYLINHQTKVTGTHPFYIQTETGIKLTKVQNLRQGDRLIERDNSLKTISSIEHINKSISVYNLISINPNPNFYADGFLVHNKGGSSGGGSYGFRGGGTGGYSTINEKTFPGFLKALTIFIVGLSCIVYWQQIYNFIIFFDKKFTEDTELIKFAIDINPNFQNKYSIWYAKDDQIWQQIAPQPELPESQYQHFISKAELTEQVSNLFIQYQHDWTIKDFESMNQYILEPFLSKQKQIFKRNFGKNFDIVYDCRLSQVLPLDLKIEEGKYFFRVQINGEMINFKLSPTGYILTGKSYHRSFSEYWELKLTPEKQCYLINISQVSSNH
ncbi:MAG: Hint domain-containing protein [Xenococcaceae cyanobacterium MO_234.B1]|nr:Hint domain-containing protein [Xenococcaceae cyanobacterium MO_234.B1]